MNKLLSLCLFSTLSLNSLSLLKAQQTNPNFSAYKNFDFIAGENLLFFDDFSQGLSQWNLVEWDIHEEEQKGRVVSNTKLGGNWYFMPRKGTSQPKNLKILPKEFTLEYDFFVDEKVSEHEGGLLNIFVQAKNLNINEYSYHFDSSPQIMMEIKPSNDLLYLDVFREYGYTGGIDETAKIFHELKESYWVPNKVYRVSIARKDAQLTLYINQDKVIDLKNALPANENYTLLLCNNLWINGYYISNLRLATGSPQPSKELKEKRLYVTHNIHFAVNSDRIQEASYPILKQVAQALKEQNANKILITGHTDSDGQAQRNLELSQKRAEAVKQILVKEFGIEASKLETEGLGQTQPLADNKTIEGKAKNRRVSFSIKG